MRIAILTMTIAVGRGRIAWFDITTSTLIRIAPGLEPESVLTAR